jgi:hypothetical protein
MTVYRDGKPIADLPAAADLQARCEATCRPVWSAADRVHGDRCSKRAAVTIEGRGYCVQHAKIIAGPKM